MSLILQSIIVVKVSYLTASDGFTFHYPQVQYQDEKTGYIMAKGSDSGYLFLRKRDTTNDVGERKLSYTVVAPPQVIKSSTSVGYQRCVVFVCVVP